MRKKVILFIVEGITDKESLELGLQDVLERDNTVVFEIAQGDITANWHSNPKNIKRKLADLVKDGGKRKFLARDYREVIHIIDTDGAFIPEENIIEDENYRSFHYTEEGIFNKDPERVKQRNRQKQSLVDLLLSTDRVCQNIPYRLFYFSCNLEHVLHNEINTDDRNKRSYAEKFQDRYAEHPEEFVRFLCESDFSVKGSYEQSWGFIKTQNNSLKRYTNLNIFLKEILGL